jgi:citrate lyase subunit beta/citryl-CoA lyase
VDRRHKGYVASTEADVRLMRSLLFVPANRDRMIAGARRSAADAIVLDLEDAVAGAAKPEGRAAAAAAIPAFAADGRELFVRLNGLASRLTRDDVLAVVRPGLAGVVLPKVDAPQHLRDLDVLLREAEMANDVRPGDIAVIPIIESARAVLRCEEIAQATDRLIALSIGGEDYSADIGVERDAGGIGLQHIRSVVVQVATAYGLAPIDTPYADYRDEKGLIAETTLARAIGLKGKYVIHPDQIATANRLFAPDARQAADARRVIDAYERALADGVGSVSLHGRMVDAPVAARARALLAAVDTVAGAGRKRPARARRT